MANTYTWDEVQQHPAPAIYGWSSIERSTTSRGGWTSIRVAPRFCCKKPAETPPMPSRTSATVSTLKNS